MNVEMFARETKVNVCFV